MVNKKNQIAKLTAIYEDYDTYRLISMLPVYERDNYSQKYNLLRKKIIKRLVEKQIQYLEESK